MYQRILESNWCDKSKDLGLETVYQFSEFLGKPVEKPEFRVYRNQEAYVPSPTLLYFGCMTTRLIVDFL